MSSYKYIEDSNYESSDDEFRPPAARDEKADDWLDDVPTDIKVKDNNVLIVGLTGSGKSGLINNMIRSDDIGSARAGRDLKPVTLFCDVITNMDLTFKGEKLATTFIDTIGLGDETNTFESIRHKTLQVIQQCGSVINSVILSLNIARLNHQHSADLKKMLDFLCKDLKIEKERILIYVSYSDFLSLDAKKKFHRDISGEQWCAGLLMEMNESDQDYMNKDLKGNVLFGCAPVLEELEESEAKDWYKYYRNITRMKVMKFFIRNAGEACRVWKNHLDFQKSQGLSEIDLDEYIKRLFDDRIGQLKKLSNDADEIKRKLKTATGKEREGLTAKLHEYTGKISKLEAEAGVQVRSAKYSNMKPVTESKAPEIKRIKEDPKKKKKKNKGIGADVVNRRTVFVFGITGSGKSSLVNLLTNEWVNVTRKREKDINFQEVGTGLKPKTQNIVLTKPQNYVPSETFDHKKFKFENEHIEGTFQIRVLDTIGSADMSYEFEKIIVDIEKCLTDGIGGFNGTAHGVVICIRMDRWRKNTKSDLDKMISYAKHLGFPPNNILVLITHNDFQSRHVRDSYRRKFKECFAEGNLNYFVDYGEDGDTTFDESNKGDDEKMNDQVKLMLGCTADMTEIDPEKRYLFDEILWKTKMRVQKFICHCDQDVSVLGEIGFYQELDVERLRMSRQVETDFYRDIPVPNEELKKRIGFSVMSMKKFFYKNDDGNCLYLSYWFYHYLLEVCYLVSKGLNLSVIEEPEVLLSRMIKEQYPILKSKDMIDSSLLLSPIKPTKEAQKKKRKEEDFKTRVEAIREFKETEKSYLHRLYKLELFIIKLKDMLEPKKVKIFSNVTAILQLSKDLYGKLVETTKFENTGDGSVLLGKLILEYIPYLNMYKSYINNYNPALDLVEEIQSSLATLNEKEVTELKSLLIEPIQRVPRYILLLKQIIKYTDINHPDFDYLQKALRQLNITADALNEGLRDYENRNKVYEIQKHFLSNYKLVAPHRIFLKQKKLKVMPYNKLCECILFSDKLVIVEEILNRYILKTEINIDEHFTAVEEMKVTSKEHQSIHIDNVDNSITLIISNEDYKDWVDTIRNCIKSYMSTVLSNCNQREVDLHRLKAVEKSLWNDYLLEKKKSDDIPQILSKFIGLIN